ncbi:MAG: TolB family protein [Actinomycetota bacterium]
MRPRRLAAAGVVMLVISTLAGIGNAYPRPGRTELVSVSSDGRPGNAEAAMISATGRYVVFVSEDPKLVVPDANLGADVFWHDRKTGTTELVSLSGSGAQGVAIADCAVASPDVSADGRFVAFYSNASNLVPGDRNDAPDVFVRDRRNGDTELVSISSDGEQQNEGVCSEENGEEQPSLAISRDGRYVTWVSGATNLVKRDTNNHADIFVHDRRKGTTERVSVATDGTEATDWSSCPVFNPTGRFVAFWSIASNLVEQDANEAGDVFVRDLRTDKTQMVSLRSDGVANSSFGGGGLECGGGSRTVAISRNGRFVAFSGLGSELVPRDEPPLGGTLDADVFVRDRKTGRTERISVTSDGEESEGGFAVTAAISDNGRFVTFVSSAKNLYPDDDEELIPIAFGDDDVFVHDRIAGSTELVSVGRDGDDGRCDFPGGELLVDGVNGAAGLPSISASGRFIAFTSCDTNLEGSPQRAPDRLLVEDRIYVRDQGALLGAVKGRARPAAGPSLPGLPHFSKTGTIYVADERDDAETSLAVTELLGARLSYRPRFRDLYLKLDVDRLADLDALGMGTGAPLTAYGFRMRAGGVDFELRATPLGEGHAARRPSFELLRCDGDVCWRQDLLRGGWGTIGESIVMTVPLDRLGLARGGRVDYVGAFVARNLPSSVAPRPVDLVVLHGDPATAGR